MTDRPNPLPRRWTVHPPIPPDIRRVLRDYPAFLRQLLYNRGINTPEAAAAFIACEVPYSTDPFLLKDMHAAVARLNTAITNHERIAIYGDYDADGVTASALMYQFLNALGIQPRVYIPRRDNEGYGLNEGALRLLAEEGTDLLITVDCGERAEQEVALAVALGMDMIITDHHSPGNVRPPAIAVINPKQAGDVYPYPSLAGVGLAYKLTQAYLQVFPQEGVDPADWVDLVAIGTVADVAELTGENRMLTKQGLERIRQGSRPGLAALARVAGVNAAICTTADIGFRLGPRLNAAGRMDTAMTAVDLLTATDYHQAGKLAQELDSHNNLRQEETHSVREQAAARVLEQDPNALLFFAADPAFNKGIVGLAASRLSETYYRPAIIGHQGEEFTVASCRSIKEFHITRALDECAHLLVRHGGHAAAAGFTVRNENVPELVNLLTAIAERELVSIELTPVIDIDRENKLDKLEGEHITGIFNDLHQLEPTGRGNPEPVFASYNLKVLHARTVGTEKTHLKLTLQAGEKVYDAIAFQQGHWIEQMPDWVDIAYRFEKNLFNGIDSLQLNIRDLRPAKDGVQEPD